MFPGILICRGKIAPTHHALRPDRKGMYANLVLAVILWYFEMISGVFIWLQHNKLYGLIDSECMHIPCHFMDKTGNPLIIKWEISSSVNHMWQNISRLVTKGDLYNNMMKFRHECLSHNAKWLPHTHLLLGSSHVKWHISAGYRRGVISKYD